MIGRSGLLLCAVGSLAALDDAPARRVADLRIFAGVTDGYEFLNVDGDDGLRVGAGYFRSFVDDYEGDVSGLMVGLEVAGTRSDGPDIDIETIAATGHIGLAYQTDVRQLHLELGPLFGIGRNSVEFVGESTSGTYYEAGVRGALFWTFDAGLQLGIDARWQTARAYIDVADERRSAESRGFMGSAVVGWRF
ncbi:MAG TPA: hypothetical protein VEL07_13785 [Planctomycetota bacterium]|nr:hypothetical protein [Planctomycetota bacterium]